MALSQAERIRRELKKEIGDYELLAEILHLVKRGEQSKIVDYFYSRFVAIAIEQAVVEGHFSIHRFFRIEARDLTDEGALRIDAKVSDTIKLLRKAYLAGVDVNRNNYEEVILAIRQEMKDKNIRNSDLYNPMIDEED